MKRIFVLMLTFILCCQAVGCQSSGKTAVGSKVQSQATTKINIPDLSGVAQVTEEPEQEETEAAATATQSQNSNYSSHESVALETVEEPDVEPVQATIQTSYAHTSVAASSYYQYSCLSGTEKNIYLAICKAMQNCDAIVDLGSYGCSFDTASKVYYAVIADYPQFFYLAKSFAYTYQPGKNTIKNFILLYSDGTTSDQYDEKGNLAVTADRSLISQQIVAFNSAISKIVSGIPTSATALEKERKIYEYILDSVAYDTQVASTSVMTSHAYDAYGAVCENLAVCEGYSELFQYLCYCVGLNATPVHGTSSGSAHEWNAVKLDSDWYMVDATWDDTTTQGMYGYSYFNLTTSEMCKDHTIDYETLSVPSCTATTCAFYNLYALYISSTSSAPENYATVIDNLVANGDKYLCVYVGNQSGNMQEYISKYIFGRDSEVQKYIKQKGYSLSFQSTYYTIRNYCYIPLK